MSLSRRLAPVVLLALASLSGAALLAVPEPAEACGKGVCPRGYFAPREATTVPANVPALVHVGSPPSDEGTARATITTDGGATELGFTTDVGGGSGLLLRPLTPLESGKTYAVSHYQSCGTGAPVGVASHTFVAGPVAPLPTTLGDITSVEPYVDGAYSVYAGSKCWDPMRAAVARLIFQPSEEIAPWLAVTSFAFTVDGEPYEASQWGHGPNDVVPHPYWQRWLLEAHGACEIPTKESQLFAGLPLGTHTYTVEARIAGIEAPVGKIEGSFVLACDGVPEGSGEGTAGSGNGAAGAATGTGSAGSGAAAGAPSSSGLAPAPGSGSGSDGCSVSGRSSSSGTSALGLLFALGALFARGGRRRG